MSESYTFTLARSTARELYSDADVQAEKLRPACGGSLTGAYVTLMARSLAVALRLPEITHAEAQARIRAGAQTGNR
jgi:hypothetical protein